MTLRIALLVLIPPGITLYSSQGALIQNNYITNLYDNTGRASGIEIWTSIQTITQYNTVISKSTQQSGGILIRTPPNTTTPIRYNYIDMTTAAGNAYGLTVDDDGGSGTTDVINNNIVIANNPVYLGAMDVGGYPNNQNHQQLVQQHVRGHSKLQRRMLDPSRGTRNNKVLQQHH